MAKRTFFRDEENPFDYYPQTSTKTEYRDEEKSTDLTVVQPIDSGVAASNSLPAVGNVVSWDIISNTSNAPEDNADVTANNTAQDTTYVNNSLAENVQERAENKYTRQVFEGRNNDGLTETVSAGGTITRRLLNTLLQSGNNDQYARITGATSFGYGTISPSATTLDWSDANFEFSIIMQLKETTNQDGFIGLFDQGSALGGMIGLNSTDTNRHVGFYIQDNKIYASNADGATQTKTELTTVTLTNKNHYSWVYTQGTDIKFYVNDVLVATHTTNLPTTSGGADQPTLLFLIYGSGVTDRQMLIRNNYLLIVY